MTIGSAILAVGSAAANSAAQSKATHARNDALLAERIRQRQYDQQAAAVNDRARGRYEDFGGTQAKAEGELTQLFNPADAAPGPAATGIIPGSDSNVVVAEEGAQRAKAKGESDAQGAALATLRSFGDALGGASRGTARDAGEIGQIGGFKTGSANVLPIELDAAAQKGAGLRMFGDILGGLSQIALMKGLSAPGGSAAQVRLGDKLSGMIKPNGGLVRLGNVWAGG